MTTIRPNREATMACGNTYTRKQFELASRSTTDLEHPKATPTLREDRKKAILSAFKKQAFESGGKKGLPRLRILTNDPLEIDGNGDIAILRPVAGGFARQVGVAFAHSLSSGNYKGFSIQKVESVKHKILQGELTAFHFVTSGSFPPGIQPVIEAANDDLRKAGKDNDHLINFHHNKQYPFLLPPP